jgi:hypothetical protein
MPVIAATAPMLKDGSSSGIALDSASLMLWTSISSHLSALLYAIGCVLSMYLAEYIDKPLTFADWVLYSWDAAHDASVRIIAHAECHANCEEEGGGADEYTD